MKNKINKIVKSILLLVIGMIAFNSSINNVNAVAQTITLGDAEPIEGYVAGVYFTTKTTTSGGYLYCLNLHKATAKNVTATLVGERDAGIAYILENGYPNKSITGERTKDYYITQTAIWWYLDETTNSNNLGDDFKSTGSDPHNLRPKIKQLVTTAQEKRKQGYSTTKLTISVKDNSMTLKDNYYVSEEISATTHSNISEYTVSLSNAPTGTKIVDESGTEKTKFSASEKFIIKVPASKLNGTKLNIKVTAKATGTVNKAYEYKPTDANMQNVTPSALVPETTNVSSSIDLEISTSKVTIVKIDKATGKTLAGAKLALKDSTGQVITTWTTTTNAHVIKNLSNGTYTISEVEAPKGYKLSNEEVKFTITDSDKDVSVKFYNEAKSTVVNILKVDKSTGNPLAGAVLVVKDSTGKEIARFETTTDPYVLTNLEDGTYTVEEESAPAGYIKSDEKITFTIDDDHLSHQITFENYPEVSVPNTSSTGSIILTILGIVIIGTGIGFVYKNGKKAK